VNRIRIAFIASTFVVGGAERVTQALVSRLPRDRFECAFLFLREAGPIGRELFCVGCGGAERLQHGRFDTAVLVRLARRLRRWRPDVLFCMDHHNALLWGRLAGLLAGVPAQVAVSHSTGLFGKRGSFPPSDRWLMEFTDRVVALSPEHARYLRDEEGIAAGKIVVVENGVDVGRYSEPVDSTALRASLGLSPTDRVVLMVAALRPEKAHEALLEAASRLVASGDSPTFLLAGAGPRRAELEGRSKALGLDGKVRFLGVRDDVAQLLHVSDVLVLPSHDVVETLPLAVLEAMAARVPVVASRVGSIPGLVRDRVDGLLIEPADAVELAAGIAYILRNPVAAREMADSARARVSKRYSIERMVERYQDLFEGLAAGKRAA
jgi:glycosyltransferase involved in cell wall biosynthesis